jgi:hypothetical protein
MAYYETRLLAPIGIGCTSCAASGLGSYEAWTVGRTRMPPCVYEGRCVPKPDGRLLYIGPPVRAYSGLGAAPIIAVSGLGEEPPPGTPTPAPVLTADADRARAERAAVMGKGLFLGAAYGIAIGMVLSETVARKPDPAKQLKQNHQFVALSALFGAAVGAFFGVQAPTPQA